MCLPSATDVTTRDQISVKGLAGETTNHLPPHLHTASNQRLEVGTETNTYQ